MCFGAAGLRAAPDPASLAKSAPDSRSVAAAPVAGAEKFVPIFAPLRTTRAALSPDGGRVAYSLRKDDRTALIFATADAPGKPTATVLIGTDRDATRVVGTKEEYPLRVLFMGWTSADRLVLATNAFPSGGGSGEILGIDADGKNAKTLFTPSDALTVADGGLPATGRGLATPPRARIKSHAGDGNIRLPRADQEAADPDPQRTPEHVLGEPGEAGERAAASLPMVTHESSRSLGELELLDLWPGERDEILIKAGAGVRYGLYRVNARTGAKLSKKLFDLDQAFVPMLDRAGRPRIGIPWSEHTPYPWSLRFDFSAKGADAKRDLATLLPEAARPHVGLTAENFFGERVMPLSFDYDGATLYYASNVGRDTYAVYAANLVTKQESAIELAVDGVDLAYRGSEGFGSAANLVFDRHRRQLAGVRYRELRSRTAWIDPELQDLQQRLEGSFPGRNVEIQEWDQARRRFLLRVTSAIDAGSFHVFDQETQRLTEFAWNPQTSAPADGRHHRLVERRIVRDDGLVVAGRLILPRLARTRPLPVLIVCPDGPMESLTTQFDSELVAFAEMGVAILQANPRGTDGFGLKHLHAISNGHADAQIADLLALLDDFAKTYAIDPRRVVITGERYGGYLALRAMQRQPDRFRGVIARDPYLDLRDELTVPSGSQEWNRIDAQRRRWFFGSDEQVDRGSIFATTKPLAHPALITGDPRSGSPESSTARRYRAANRFVTREQAAGATVEFLGLDDEQLAELPKARARLFARFEEFLNLSLYDYGVKLGAMEEVSDVESQP